MSRRSLHREALRWLRRHDPDFDWTAYDRRPTHGRDFVGAVRDNISSFGVEHVGRLSAQLRAAVIRGVS